jgi:hypothetical protein
LTLFGYGDKVTPSGSWVDYSDFHFNADLDSLFANIDDMIRAETGINELIIAPEISGPLDNHLGHSFSCASPVTGFEFAAHEDLTALEVVNSSTSLHLRPIAPKFSLEPLPAGPHVVENLTTQAS